MDVTPLTVKQLGRGFNGNWREFIDREQSSVDQLIKDSFAEYRKKRQQEEEQEEAVNKNNSSFSTAYGSLARMRRPPSSHQPTSTMPRRSSKISFNGDVLESFKPAGIEELETLYAPMRNLLHSLPCNNNDSATFGGSMPPPHDFRVAEDDEISLASCSVPPPPAPVLSHAVLERSLGHEIPRTPLMPMRTAMNWEKAGSPPPPLPPKRTCSAVPPSALRLCQNSGGGIIYANANVCNNRSSLMSTDGSSSNSSTSSSSSAANSSENTSIMIMETSLETPSSDKLEAEFSWPAVTGGVEHRSVSQTMLGDAAADRVSPSSSYVKMRHRHRRRTGEKESHYMNVLYHSTDPARPLSESSPYIAMAGGGASGSINSNDVRNNPNAISVESVSALYAKPVVTTSSPAANKIRKRSSSASRLSEITSRVMKNGSGRSRNSNNSSSQVLMRELMREVDKKRRFRVGLNIFNSKPEWGVEYLVQRDFLELSPSAVAKFLVSNNVGLSKDKIGEYLCDLQSPFSMKCLSCFVDEIDFAGQRVDKALRRLLQSVRVPGEAQKIERVMEVFGKRYNRCNPSFAARLRSADSVVTLAFAVLLLNTDLHAANVKTRMGVDDFVNNLRGVDGGKDFDPKLLKRLFRSVKKEEIRGGSDHVIQTQLIQKTIQGVGKQHPNLAEPHRRLVCVCRLYEVDDINSRKESSQHQRDIYLFNDLVVLTKPSASSEGSSVYKDSFLLRELDVTLFKTATFKNGIQISNGGQVLLTLNAGSEHDRYKFAMDLQESILEMAMMERVLRDLAR